MFGPTLFTAVDPPEVVVRMEALKPGPIDERELSIRIKPLGQKSLNFKAVIDRYSPEWTVLLAVSHGIKSLEAAQTTVDAKMLAEVMTAALREYVSPF